MTVCFHVNFLLRFDWRLRDLKVQAQKDFEWPSIALNIVSGYQHNFANRVYFPFGFSCVDLITFVNKKLVGEHQD